MQPKVKIFRDDLYPRLEDSINEFLEGAIVLEDIKYAVVFNDGFNKRTEYSAMVIYNEFVEV
jgi:hypothetical protein